MTSRTRIAAWSSCHGKKRYGTWKHAANDARTMRHDRYRNDPEIVAPYACRHCGGFHVGHKLETKP